MRRPEGVLRRQGPVPDRRPRRPALARPDRRRGPPYRGPASAASPTGSPRCAPPLATSSARALTTSRSWRAAGWRRRRTGSTRPSTRSPRSEAVVEEAEAANRYVTAHAYTGRADHPRRHGRGPRHRARQPHRRRGARRRQGARRRPHDEPRHLLGAPGGGPRLRPLAGELDQGRRRPRPGPRRAREGARGGPQPGIRDRPARRDAPPPGRGARHPGADHPGHRRDPGRHHRGGRAAAARGRARRHRARGGGRPRRHRRRPAGRHLRTGREPARRRGPGRPPRGRRPAPRHLAAPR